MVNNSYLSYVLLSLAPVREGRMVREAYAG
jgi:hypothetical protein